MINLKRDIGMVTGVISVVVCLIFGFVENQRLTTILFRTLVCFAIMIILFLFIITIVEKFTQGHQPTPQHENADKLDNTGQRDKAISKAS